MKSEEMGPPILKNVADFPILDVNDDLECTVRICQVRDDDNNNSSPFLPAHNYYLELQLCIMPQSGFVVNSGGSPWIRLAHYVGILKAKPALNTTDGPKIRLWCHKATPMYNTKEKRIMSGLELQAQT
ncbi:hypothetical protein EST38_g14283 [Candolleomyces aberdarensis]|uniref:Uncharacterized protein n=1 Tax=Candolleomyces aberdarensis TaxID=2316362 RepID=A0A4Q2CXT0_9AGAR|nr:hypothetical protein EST38_g14283 [Candolleomyces aberdarensis]